MTSGPITAWQMGKGGRRKGRSSDRFPLLGLQNHCGWWLQLWYQKMFASWPESDDKPRQCVLKSRDITLLTKVWIVKDMVFPMVTDSCESWTIKKEEHQRIDAFKLWCWRRLLKVPWIARISNQSILRTDAETEVYSYSVFLLHWTFYYYWMSFFVSYNLFWFHVCIVWY